MESARERERESERKAEHKAEPVAEPVAETVAEPEPAQHDSNIDAMSFEPDDTAPCYGNNADEEFDSKDKGLDATEALDTADIQQFIDKSDDMGIRCGARTVH